MGAQRRTFARNRNGQGTITVLWAEDDQLNNQPAVEALEYEGFRVLTATSGSMVLKDFVAVKHSMATELGSSLVRS